MKLLAFVALILGVLGVLLCLGGIAGAFWVQGTVVGHIDRGHKAVDDVLDGVQEGVADAIPRIKRARKRLAVQTAEKIVPDLVHVRARIEGVARTGEAAASLLDALGRDGVLVAELQAHFGELRSAARDLVDTPEKRGPALERAEAHFIAIHTDLSELRIETADLRNRAEKIVGLATFVLAGFFVWMGLGQACLARRRRQEEL